MYTFVKLITVRGNIERAMVFKFYEIVLYAL